MTLEIPEDFELVSRVIGVQSSTPLVALY